MNILKRQIRSLIHPLENLRTEQKFTQAELANRTGLRKNLIGRFERGLQIPDYDEAVALGRHYNLEWYRVVELCIQHRDRRDRLIARFKMSESSLDSHVCTTPLRGVCHV